MIPVIKIIRDTYTLKATTGKLYVEDEFFCYTLEDVARALGVKIKHHTCLAPGMYKVGVTMSSRFKREMPIIYTESNGYEARMGGISFKGARFHGGNDDSDTSGCPLVAYRKISDEKIYKTAEKELTAKIKNLIAEGGKGYIYLFIENKEQNG